MSSRIEPFLIERSLRREWPVVLALVVLYLVVQTLYLKVPNAADPGHYFYSAARIPDLIAHHRTTRLGILLPVRAAMRVFGPSEASYYFLPYVTGVLLVISTYSMAFLWFGRSVALGAGLLCFANPFILRASSQIFSDLPATAAFTAGIAALLLARPAGRGRPAWLVVSGACFGGAYLTREVVLLLFPLVPLLCWQLRLRMRALVLVAAAAAAVASLDFVYGWLAYDDPLIRLKVLLGRSDDLERINSDMAEYRNEVRAVQSSFLRSLGILPRELLAQTSGFFFVLLLGLLLVVSCWNRRPGLRLLAGWVFGLWGVYCLLGLFETPSGDSILTLEIFRYWFLLFPALIVGGLGAASSLLPGRATPLLALALALVASAAGWRDIHLTAHDQSRHHSSYLELRDWLAREGARYPRLASDKKTWRLLPMFVRSPLGRVLYAGDLELLDRPEYPPEAEVKVGLVLYNAASFQNEYSVRRRTAPDYFTRQPDGWSLQWISSDGELVLYAKGTPERFETRATVGTTDRPWLATVRDGAAEAARAAGSGGQFKADAHKIVTLTNRRPGPAGDEGGEAIRVAGGDVLHVRARLEVKGTGSLRLFGVLVDADGASQEVPCVTGLRVPFDEGEADFLLAVPGAKEDAYRLRLLWQCRGPLRGFIGEAKVLQRQVTRARVENVLLVSVDTLRADHLGFLGYPRPTSPNLDRLASQSVVFERAYSVASWTLPSIASLMTSLHPSGHRCEADTNSLGDSHETLAERLRAAGFATGAVSSHFYLSDRFGLEQGFEQFDQELVRASREESHRQISSPEVTRRGIAWLDQQAAAGASRPWFLWLHYFDPHSDYVVHTGFTEKFGSSLLDRYDGEIAFTDAAIGELLAHLDGLGLAASTAVVVVADHGEEFRDHGGSGHRKTLYEEVVRIPLLVRLPGQSPGRVATPVSIVDVFPTIVELLEMPGESPGGHSLVPLLRDPSGPTPPPVFAELTNRGAGNWDAVVDGRYKLLRDRDADRDLLFDLDQDPAEQHDIAALQPERLQAMRALLERCKAAAGLAARGHGEGRALDLSAEEQQRLRDLGYLDEDR